MDIRSATPADLSATAALHAANWRRDYGDVLSRAALGAPLADQIGRLWGSGGALDMGWHAVRVPGQGGDVADFVLYRPEDNRVHVGALHVAHGQRGRGVGAGFLAYVGHLAGPQPVWLEVLVGNHAARAIYRHRGGREGAPLVACLGGAAQS